MGDGCEDGLVGELCDLLPATPVGYKREGVAVVVGVGVGRVIKCGC